MFRDGKYYCNYCGKELGHIPPSLVSPNDNNFCNREHSFLYFRKYNEYIIYENYAEIVVKHQKYGKYFAKIDKEDIEKCKKFHWRLQWAIDRFYIVSRSKKLKLKNVLLHRYLMDCPKDMVIDHINNDGLDNRKSNLQVVTRKQNQENRKLHKNNKTGVNGVYWNKIKKRYIATIKINKKSKSWNFKTLEEAKKKVIEMRNLYYTNNLIDRGLREK